MPIDPPRIPRVGDRTRYVLAALALTAVACSSAETTRAPEDGGAGAADVAVRPTDGGSVPSGDSGAMRVDAALGDASPASDAEPLDAGLENGTDAAAPGDGGPADGSSIDGGAPGDAVPRACPSMGPAVALGAVTEPDLLELSGLAAGRVSPDVYWTHNDARVELFAIDRATLALRARYELTSSAGDAYGAGDVEDIAIRALPGGGAEVYLADIGSGHPDLTLHIYRVEEPLVPATFVEGVLVAEVMNVSAIRIRNAETLLADPLDGTLVIVEKEQDPRACPLGLFTAGALARPTCGSVVPGLENPSGGDVSPDGTFIAIRNESLAHVWIRPPGSPLVAAFAGSSCPFSTLATPSTSDECNGEALAFSSDGTELISGSERGGCPSSNLHAYTFSP